MRKESTSQDNNRNALHRSFRSLTHISHKPNRLASTLAHLRELFAPFMPNLAVSNPTPTENAVTEQTALASSQDHLHLDSLQCTKFIPSLSAELRPHPSRMRLNDKPHNHNFLSDRRPTVLPPNMYKEDKVYFILSSGAHPGRTKTVFSELTCNENTQPMSSSDNRLKNTFRYSNNLRPRRSALC